MFGDVEPSQGMQIGRASKRPDKPLSAMAFAMLLRRMQIANATAHGFRSAFRDWVGDCTPFPREVAEAALAHAVGDETEIAYRRSDALEKRRKLMSEWSCYCEGRSGGAEVMDFPGPRERIIS
jgi:integrase